MEEHIKEIAKELKLIRLELEQMNGVQIAVDGPKMNLKALGRMNVENKMKRNSAVNSSSMT